MITEAALAAWITSNAQEVAHAAEVDRCRIVRPTCSAGPVSAMPKPSKAWVDATAHEILSSPLFVGDPKTEAVHMLVYAARESGYGDRAVGDHGGSFCSLGVKPEFHHVTGQALKDSPALCVKLARVAMRWSFAANATHPMAQYCGNANGREAILIADARAALVKSVAASLPAIEETPS